MSKKFLLLLSLVLILGVAAFILWRMDKVSAPVVTPVPTPEETSKVSEISTETTPEFVVNVDPDVKNWQTKDTEFFTIKFPKEWYWLELSEKETEYRNMYVISNNRNFPLKDYKNDPIGMIGIDERTLLQGSEVVITFSAAATTDSGTPMDSLNFLTRPKENTVGRKCIKPLDTQALPLIASCSSKEKDRFLQNYYIVSETTSFTLTAYTNDDTVISQDIFEKIAQRIKLKK